MAINKDQSYLACFCSTNLRRAEIASMAWVSQAYCGAGPMSFLIKSTNRLDCQKNAPSTSTLRSTPGHRGYETHSLRLHPCEMCFVLTNFHFRLARILVPRSPPHTLPIRVFHHVSPLARRCGCSVVPRSDAPAWDAGSLPFVSTFYNLAIGSAGYPIVFEIPSTHLKDNTVALARRAYNIKCTTSHTKWLSHAN